jgi:hypothetical protein
VSDRIDPDLAAWIEAQPVFFVATAPSGAGGHVNLSPKGYDTLRVLDDRTVAYVDLTGSGIETVAHLQENGRVTFMLCAFQGPPRIVRLHGTGEVVVPGDDEWEQLLARFPNRPGVRAVVKAAVTRVSTTCGFAVPFMELAGERPTLDQVNGRKGDEALAVYRAEKNAVSLDGLPGLPDLAPS